MVQGTGHEFRGLSLAVPNTALRLSLSTEQFGGKNMDSLNNNSRSESIAITNPRGLLRSVQVRFTTKHPFFYINEYQEFAAENRRTDLKLALRVMNVC